MSAIVSAAARPVVLAVDDSSDHLALIQKMLGRDYQVLVASDGGSALDLAAGQPRPHLILLDIEMPGASGFELCQVLKSEGSTADIPVIFLTVHTDEKTQVEGFQRGAVDFITKPITTSVLRARVRTHVSLAHHCLELERMVRERTAQLETTRLQIIRRLARAMEMHESAAVGNRVVRLGQYAKLLAQAAGAKAVICEMLMTAAPLHDVGKLGVPAEVLRRPAKLSAPDWERVKRHPLIGAEIIGEHDDPLLQLARQMALSHHERWDGTGYPQGLKGDAIPWAARLMAIVDAFEAMTTTQFYREPRNVLEAAAEITAGSGSMYDPKLVEAFRKAFPTLRKVRETYADSLGDMINLDFSPTREALRTKPSPGQGANEQAVRQTQKR